MGKSCCPHDVLLAGLVGNFDIERLKKIKKLFIGRQGRKLTKSAQEQGPEPAAGKFGSATAVLQIFTVVDGFVYVAFVKFQFLADNYAVLVGAVYQSGVRKRQESLRLLANHDADRVAHAHVVVLLDFHALLEDTVVAEAAALVYQQLSGQTL